MPYSPFQKPLGDLETADLAVLKDVSVGWYVEYKQEVSKAPDIAKSISAFANTYGGWVFYGIEEKSKTEPVAGNFPGIARSDVDACLQRVRQAIATQANPSPHFDTKILWGPSEPIGLLADRAVICIFIPSSPNAPHIHSRGLIYRRVADGSEPRPETDRHVIDQMRHGGDQLQKYYAGWVDKDPEFSKEESNKPYLRLLLATDLWKNHGLWFDPSLNRIKEIMNSEAPITSIPFDTVYPSANGFVCRQNLNNSPNQLNLTWRLSRRLDSEILIPLNIFEFGKEISLTEHLEGFATQGRFVKMLHQQCYDHAKITDLNFLFTVLNGIIHIQETLQQELGWDEAIYAKARLLNVWRTCPFLDIDLVLNLFETHGIPMCLDKRIEIFAGADPGTFFEIPTFEDVETDAGRVGAKAMILFTPIARAFGVPSWLEFGADPDGAFVTELLGAANRGLEAQRRRNDRKQTGGRRF